MVEYYFGVYALIKILIKYFYLSFKKVELKTKKTGEMKKL
jgi:hypothetical protein